MFCNYCGRELPKDANFCHEDQAKVVLVLSGELEWAENGATAIDPLKE